jgi:hypothetical protein
VLERPARRSTLTSRVALVPCQPNGWPLSCGRANPTMTRVGLKPSDWLKPAAASFSGLLGGRVAPERDERAPMLRTPVWRRRCPGLSSKESLRSRSACGQGQTVWGDDPRYACGFDSPTDGQRLSLTPKLGAR